MKDVMDCGEYSVHYRAEEIDGRMCCTDVLDYVQDGRSVKREDLERDFVIIDEHDIQAFLDEQAAEPVEN